MTDTKTINVRVGDLTECELEIVLDSIKRICDRFNVVMSDPVKPRPMYREITLTGDFWDVTTITNLMYKCELYD